MKNQVREWLESDHIDIFIGYRLFKGHPLPHGFTKEKIGEVEDLVEGTARYPLEKLAAQIAKQDPTLKIGLMVRDCTLRSLNVLYLWNQLDPDRIETITVNCCPSPVKDHADCSYLTQSGTGSSEKIIGLDNGATIEEFERYDQVERFSQWSYEFDKCLKCYGCRNICPVCFCKECSLEHEDLVGVGDLPVEVPIFHLVRAVHMAGRCIDCGLCEEACPVDIPLRLLYGKVNQIVGDIFDYQTGTSSARSPFNILGDEALEPAKMNSL
jgi:ferredoxin